jgi:hypothetical protein
MPARLTPDRCSGHAMNLTAPALQREQPRVVPTSFSGGRAPDDQPGFTLSRGVDVKAQWIDCRMLTLLVVVAAAIGCRSGELPVPATSLIGTSWRAEEIDGRGVLELQVLGDRIVFVGDYGAQRLTTLGPPKQVGSTTGEELYVAVTDAHRMTVLIRPGPCVDTMSGDRHGSTVEVELDGTTHRGCGDALR